MVKRKKRSKAKVECKKAFDLLRKEFFRKFEGKWVMKADPPKDYTGMWYANVIGFGGKMVHAHCGYCALSTYMIDIFEEFSAEDRLEEQGL